MSLQYTHSLTLHLPPRARPGPPRPSLASGGPPAAARCGGVTNPTAEHRDAVGRSEVQLGVCIAHPGLSPGPINRRLRSCDHEVLFVHTCPTIVQHSNRAELRKDTTGHMSRLQVRSKAKGHASLLLKNSSPPSGKCNMFVRRGISIATRVNISLSKHVCNYSERI